MPAAVRGGRQQANPRAKKPAGAKRGRPQAPQGRGPGAAKLRAAQGLGLSPKLAVGAAGGVLALVLIAALATGNRGERLIQAMGAGVANQTAAMGFRTDNLHVEGANPAATQAVMGVIGARKGQPILSVNLDQLRQDVEKVGWVKSARVVRLLPDTLLVAVEQRDTLAVWQNNHRVYVIDGEGHVIREADPGRYPELPLVVGAGADVAAASILPAVTSRPRLRDRLEALVRVDGRRWDLLLKDGSLVQLPAVDEDSALIQLDQLDDRQRILELGFARIDLREPGEVAVRRRDAAPSGELVAGGA